MFYVFKRLELSYQARHDVSNVLALDCYLLLKSTGPIDKYLAIDNNFSSHYVDFIRLIKKMEMEKHPNKWWYSYCIRIDKEETVPYLLNFVVAIMNVADAMQFKLKTTEWEQLSYE